MIPHLRRTPIVQISDGVVLLLGESGDGSVELAMAVKTVDALGARIKRALDRYASGEQDIIEGS